jgi:cyclopropane fatty-acyl-phospholipid synthase-like methyltransferase
MKDFYEAFYAAASHSPAHHTFCERVFGLDLCQHGFLDQEQMDLLLKAARLTPKQRVLDLGCGNGMIAEHISDRTGAHFTGIDYIASAIQQAQERTRTKAERLDFAVGDINHLDLPPHAFDMVLLIDSIYFSEDYPATIRDLKAALCPGGQMLVFYAYGREPWVSKEDFPRQNLPPNKTPLAQALLVNGLCFHTWDLTGQDYALAQKRKAVLAELKPQFEAEGNLFIYENRMGDACGISQAIAEGLHARYLYQAVVNTP